MGYASGVCEIRQHVICRGCSKASEPIKKNDSKTKLTLFFNINRYTLVITFTQKINNVLSCSYPLFCRCLQFIVIIEVLPTEVSFQTGKQVEVTLGQVWRTGWVRQFLQSTVSQSRLCNQCLVNRYIVVKQRGVVETHNIYS